ncbi:MAG: MFS transporter [Burkholderiales bacterium]|nr:MFS transporter [Burkholderiales bacterium]
MRLIRIVPALGIAQIIAWGSLFYSISVLGPHYREAFGISDMLVFGAFSTGLLISGWAAPRVGRLVQRYGGRRVLSTGSALGALSLGVLASAPNATVYCVAWLLAGLAMAASLYEPAFATLHQLSATHYRKSVTALALFGGLAITVFWPLTHWLDTTIGWRGTLVTFATLQLVVSLPLHWFVIPDPDPHRHRTGTTTATATTAPPPNATFYWLATAFALSMFVFSAIASRLIDLLKSSGLPATEAVLAASLIGPMQITGRLIELLLLRGYRPRVIAIVSFGLVCVALLTLAFTGSRLGWALAFAAIFGIGNGLMTIVRGTAPPDLLGHEHLAVKLGRLARPTFFAIAVAPLTFATLLSQGASARTGALLLALLAAIGTGCLWQAIRSAGRSPGGAVSPPPAPPP